MSLQTPKPTPAPILNRPGLPQIEARVGSHTQFLESLHRGLADSDRPGLSELGARLDADWTLGMFDAWAAVCATLTFYAERTANEAYLDTASTRESIRAHARLIGYELSPAKAAAAHLAFIAEENDAPDKVLSYLPGLQMRSIPRDGELPQTFETVDTLNVRARWNALRPRMSFPQVLSADTDTLRLTGGEPAVRPGDPVLLMQGQIPLASNGSYLRRVASIVDHAGRARTVTLKTNPIAAPVYVYATAPIFISWPAATQVTSNSLASNLLAFSVPLGGIAGSTMLAAFEPLSLSLAISSYVFAQPDPVQAVQMGVRTGFFGNVAQPQPLNSEPLGLTQQPAPPSPPLEPGKITETGNAVIDDPAASKKVHIYLDREVDEIIAGSIALIRQDSLEAYVTVHAVEPITVAAYGLSSKVTRLTLGETGKGSQGSVSLSLFSTRQASIYAAQKELPLDSLPITTSPGASDGSLGADSIELGTAEIDLAPGMLVAITGERADLQEVMASEVRRIAEVSLNKGFTVLTFSQPLTHVYQRDTVVLNANVAEATHGESVVEILGDGDATTPFAEFALKSVPLTHVAARTDSGMAPALEIRVDGVRYDLVADFAGASAEDAVYLLRISEDGVARVIFGDGITGMRLPTGQDNIIATYRRGAGASGLLEARQISLLAGKPAGIKSGINPLPPAGGADGEVLEDARTNAPLKVLTLGRVVSLRDYADYAQGFAAVAKARADWTFDGVSRPIFVTVAGQGGIALPANGTDMSNLQAALRAAGEADQRVTVRNHVSVKFTLSARLFVDAAYLPGDVETMARAALAAAFSFDARNLGEGVSHAQAIAVLQSEPGVTGVDLDAFHLTGQPATLEQRLLAAVARPDRDGAIPVPAELLTIDMGTTVLEAVT